MRVKYVVVITENIGHTMNFNMLKDDTQNIACRSNTRVRCNPLTNFLHSCLTVIPADFKSPPDVFLDNDKASAGPCAILNDDNYQTPVPLTITSDLVGIFFYVACI